MTHDDVNSVISYMDGPKIVYPRDFKRCDINYLPVNNYHVRLLLLLIVRFSLHFQTLRCVALCTVAVYLPMK